MGSGGVQHCTAGHEGSVGDLSCMSIFSACFGLLTSVQLAATTWSGQIWIPCWILPHFDVRTISVAWKLKKLSNIFWQKIYFLLHPLSKGVASLCSVGWTQPLPLLLRRIGGNVKDLPIFTFQKLETSLNINYWNVNNFHVLIDIFCFSNKSPSESV